MSELKQNFINFRTGDVCISTGENIGDIMIFIGRHSTMQHTCMLVWLDTEALKNQKIKVHPWYIDDNTTTLSFLGLAEGSKIDMLTQEPKKGLILWHPEDIFTNAPIAYVRGLDRNVISDKYITRKMTEFIQEHHLKLKYAYGKKHIVTVGLGFDVFGRHPTGVLCSGAIYMFLEHICKYPEFQLEDMLEDEIKTKNIQYPSYKVPDAVDYMYVPDFYGSDVNTHPVFEKEEYRVISRKSEEDVTVLHPYFVFFAVLVIVILFLFFIINNYCESCSSGNGICRIDQKDLFDSLL